MPDFLPRECGLFLVLCLVVMLVSFRATAAEEMPALRARISPSVVNLEPGAQQQFKIVIMATRLNGARLAEKVEWAVNDIPGGNEELGVIDASGLYTAPVKTPIPREIHICALVPEAVNKHLWATVLMPADGPAYELVNEWFETKGSSNDFVDPHCIALDKDGNLLITDYNGSRVTHWTKDGKFIRDIGTGAGEAPGQVYLPRVVHVDHDGLIFVSDQKSDKPRIQVFTPDGKFLRIFAEKGTGPGHILRAHGMVFDSQHRLFVVDVDNMRVNVYEHSGEFLYTFGQDGIRTGEFNAPHGITMDANEDVFVIGYYGPTQKFTSKGEFLFDFAHADPPDNPVYFHSISSDRWGNIYLMVRGQRGYGGALEDQEGNRVSVMKYNNNGDVVGSITLKVKEHKENWAVVDKDGLVYALYESQEKRGVQVFAPR